MEIFREYRLFIDRSILIFIFILSTAHCESRDVRENMILNYPKEVASSYTVYLADPTNYTSSGKLYHSKYEKHLIGIARILVEDHKISVAKKSIGFYYDKRQKGKKILYLGLDTYVPLAYSTKEYSYEHIASKILTSYLDEILQVVHSCTTIFREKQIIGSVIGFRWKNGNRTESITIWVDKDNISRYEKRRLTIQELISRSQITNTSGKIIRLLL